MLALHLLHSVNIFHSHPDALIVAVLVAAAIFYAVVLVRS